MVKHFNLMRFVVVFALLLALTGCFSAKEEDLQAFTQAGLANASMEQYTIHPPDTVTVISTKIPELEGAASQVGQSQTVRPDGKISFENIGEISVAGKTPRQVAEIISQKLADMYKLIGDYPVDVRIDNKSKKYFILGMVRYPGAKIFSGRETTLSAIGQAVPNTLAWEEKVQVIRPSLDPSQPSKVFNLNFKKMTEHGKMDGYVFLEDGDIIYVPPTILASIGLKIQELVGPALSGGAGVNAVTGP